MRILIPLVLTACYAQAPATQPDAQTIVRRSVAAIEADWSQAPNFTYQERDVQTKKDGAPVVKTYEVHMIEGSQYNRLLAVDDKPLTAEEQKSEMEKMRAEIEKRSHESARERTKRINKYQKERTQDHMMLKSMVDAFDFTLAAEENVKGHDCWVLDATPKHGFQPRDRETKVLVGMRGRLWVEKTQYQWVRVQAEVTKPVSFYGFFAKVGPGTRFMLEQSPVSESVWLPSRFTMRVNASAFGFINENSTDDEIYDKYRPAGKALAEVNSKSSQGRP